MDRSKKFPKDMKMFDCSKTYRCPMVRTNRDPRIQIEDIIEVKLEPYKYGYFLIPQKEGYDRKFFYDLYLDWLFYTKYITVV